MSAAPTLPDGPLLAFYGDDFTGSSAAMEITAFGGLSTVLFLNPPAPKQLAQFADHRVNGLLSQGPAMLHRARNHRHLQRVALCSQLIGQTHGNLIGADASVPRRIAARPSSATP